MPVTDISDLQLQRKKNAAAAEERLQQQEKAMQAMKGTMNEDQAKIVAKNLAKKHGVLERDEKKGEEEMSDSISSQESKFKTGEDAELHKQYQQEHQVAMGKEGDVKKEQEDAKKEAAEKVAAANQLIADQKAAAKKLQKVQEAQHEVKHKEGTKALIAANRKVTAAAARSEETTIKAEMGKERASKSVEESTGKEAQRKKVSMQ